MSSEKQEIIDVYQKILALKLMITIKNFVEKNEEFLTSREILPDDIELMIKVTDLCWKYGDPIPESKL